MAQLVAREGRLGCARSTNSGDHSVLQVGHVHRGDVVLELQHTHTQMGGVWVFVVGVCKKCS